MGLFSDLGVRATVGLQSSCTEWRRGWPRRLHLRFGKRIGKVVAAQTPVDMKIVPH